MNHITITNFTDPVCTWCWGTEPVFRALETRYPGRIDFRYVMGGLVDNIDGFADPGNGINGGSDGANAQIMSHWLESADRHGMPIREEGFRLFSKKYPSTYPQNIAYKAAQIADPEKADAFLRRMREATLAEARVTSDPDVQVELAGETGMDIASLIKALRGGEAEKAFRADMAATRAAGVRGFPSFLVKTSEGRQFLVRGYKTLEDFMEIIGWLTDGSIKAEKVVPTWDALGALLDSHPRLVLEEIRQAFGFRDQKEAGEWAGQLARDGKVIREAAGNSCFFRKKNSMSCDLASGVCL